MEEEQNKDTVPASLSGLLVILYLILGTFVYYAWEDWPIVTSAYFGVVTLMTIGFGDYVPGVIPNDILSTTAGAVETSIAALYIIVGLAILSMGISLIIAAIGERMREVAKKIEDTTGWDVVEGYEGKKTKQKDEVEPFVNDEAAKA